MTETLADSQEAGGCPVAHIRPNAGTTNEDWWPDKLNLKILAKNPDVINPHGADFVYADAFNSLDLAEVKRDIATVLTDSKDWWPADFGHYGPFMIRMAWHSAGTYRVMDGRGGGSTGQQRFAPLNSWPDNVHLDKARRLLWPVKKKYGKAISWADLMILTGNVALETMGLKTFGFGGGRIDAWEPDDDVYWGSETTWLSDDKRDLLDGRRDLENPLAAVQMGLIYVNPEGPGGNSDPAAAAAHIRESFARMAMDDEETVALIAGGHTFGKTHGAGPAELVGPEPEAAPMEQQDLGWKTAHGTGKGADAVGSGLEVTWTDRPTEWTHRFFEILFEHEGEWELEESPAGAKQWVAKNAKPIIPPPNEGGAMRLPTMLTTDLTLIIDPEYRKISKRFLEDQPYFQDVFVRAWYKLTHRDMGPVARYLGPEVPSEELIWQDPLPDPGPAPTAAEIATVKSAIEGSGLSPATLVRAGFASAGSYRASDMRGGANGARVRLEPMKDFEVNNPAELASTLEVLEKARAGTKVSLADAIVLAGNVGVEQAAAAAGTPVEVPFTPGRVDASLEQTDVESFTYLEPSVDGFRNYISSRTTRPAEFGVVDRANQLDLSAPEMTVLVGGMRAIGATWDGSSVGVLTDRPGQLTNDFFVNLLDLDTTWTAGANGLYEGTGPKGQKWQGTRADLLFGANSELRAVAEVYAEDGSQEKFLADFVAAWVKVMDNDRFDVKKA